jgi:hypothetical protein
MLLKQFFENVHGYDFQGFSYDMANSLSRRFATYAMRLLSGLAGRLSRIASGWRFPNETSLVAKVTSAALLRISPCSNKVVARWRQRWH